VAIVLARFKVADYDKWRQIFESRADMRKSFGCTGTHIFYNARDKGDVIVNLQWDTEENALKFQASEELKQAMQEAGVQGPPEFTLLEDGGRTPS
jgi:hypothetical protein